MTPQYTDEQLRSTLCKMLPDKIKIVPFKMEGDIEHEPYALWKQSEEYVLDTELLHVCFLIEESLSENLREIYTLSLDCNDGESSWDICHASLQRRTIALAETKGITI